MNGRVYDQELGRFISPDPEIQAPFMTNSFNRYSYVWNNPLKYRDPTGYSVEGLGGQCSPDSSGDGGSGDHGGNNGCNTGDSSSNSNGSRGNREDDDSSSDESKGNTEKKESEVNEVDGYIDNPENAAKYGIDPVYPATSALGVFGTVKVAASLAVNAVKAAPTALRATMAAAATQASKLKSAITESAKKLGLKSTDDVANEGDDVAKMSGMLSDAAKGRGNFGIGSGTRKQADAMGKAWTGKDSIMASDGKTLVSKDGLRQYRPPTSKPNSNKATTGTQANFERRFEGQRSKRWQGNAHMDIVD